MSVIRHGLKDEGGITAYDPGPDGEDDAFRARMSGTALSAVLAGIDTLGPDAVGRFMIKEDWLFDRSRSVMEARIIGLAPMIEVRGEFGELRGFRPLFWLYYPECRQLFSWWNAAVGADGVLGGELLGDLEREVGVEAALLVDEGQLVQLARRILLELGGLLGEVGPLGVGL